MLYTCSHLLHIGYTSISEMRYLSTTLHCSLDLKSWEIQGSNLSVQLCTYTTSCLNRASIKCKSYMCSLYQNVMSGSMPVCSEQSSQSIDLKIQAKPVGHVWQFFVASSQTFMWNDSYVWGKSPSRSLLKAPCPLSWCTRMCSLCCMNHSAHICKLTLSTPSK